MLESIDLDYWTVDKHQPIVSFTVYVTLFILKLCGTFQSWNSLGRDGKAGKRTGAVEFIPTCPHYTFRSSAVQTEADSQCRSWG